jgi:hypothetical protein
MLLILFFSAGAQLDQRVPGLCQARDLRFGLLFHAHFRKQVLGQIQRQAPRIIRIRLLHRLTNYLELVRIHGHHPRYMRRHRLVEKPRVAGHLHRDLVTGPQLLGKLRQILQIPIA